jgi:hypothetical protein
MKYKIILLFILSVFVLVHCTTQKKISYDFPVAMAEPVKAEYMKLCEKGRILYEINCACCHTKKVRGKEIIPDFSQEQLVGYGLRVLNAQHEEGIPEENVTPEELSLISTFLMYKKKTASARVPSAKADGN